MGKNDSTQADTKPMAAAVGSDQALTQGRVVLYTDLSGKTHAAVAASVAPAPGGVMLWVLHCDEHAHAPYRLSQVEYDAGGKPGTWSWPPRV